MYPQAEQTLASTELYSWNSGGRRLFTENGPTLAERLFTILLISPPHFGQVEAMRLDPRSLLKSLLRGRADV